MLLLGIFVLGVLATGAIVQFQSRVDQARRAQVVIEQMRNEQSTLIGVAFSPATAGTSRAPGSAQTTLRMNAAERVLDGSLATLVQLGHSTAPGAIEALIQRDYVYVAHLSTLVATGRSREAALAWGASQRPGGLDYKLAAEFTKADNAYGVDAARSRRVASLGTIGSIAFLLVAFAVAFGYSVRSRRRSHLEATTDALTGLGNRRKLFADLERAIATTQAGTMSIGIFDLDRFKVFNDTFGHPAGDALLARLGERLAAAVAGNGSAYRIGGDEFVVLATGTSQSILSDAQAALTERGEGFAIACAFGATEMKAGMTPEEALHVADQHLYVNKRARQVEVLPLQAALAVTA
jgi:diguanylate cyclase (GGDEF)-like protein